MKRLLLLALSLTLPVVLAACSSSQNQATDQNGYAVSSETLSPSATDTGATIDNSTDVIQPSSSAYNGIDGQD